ncbi:TIM-barrel domain-containing protein [Sphingomonas sp. CLY1604]|uniref:TIM-barrel domain-containing protein n=1 Tax=Sphingomonas sp. CLY1604 TaxID=3457786 RepID=UPI003FD74070
MKDRLGRSLFDGATISVACPISRRGALFGATAIGAVGALPLPARAEGRRVDLSIPVDGGTLELTALSSRAIRVRFVRPSDRPIMTMPDILADPDRHYAGAAVERGATPSLRLPAVRCTFDRAAGVLSFHDAAGRLLLRETPGTRSLTAASLRGHATLAAAQAFDSPPGEGLYGTGCFQDGAMNLRGLPRRLTQVNTQISQPFVLSSRGYGLLWHNAGMSEWNPPAGRLVLDRVNTDGPAQRVDVTTGNGTVTVQRRPAVFEGRLTVTTPGDHALMLDLGREMASRHYLEIDGKVLTDLANEWLPPTASMVAPLSAGEHHVRVLARSDDAPVLHFGPVRPTTEWRSPVADAIDYVVIAGPSADEIMRGYRDLIGTTPMMPRWAYGFIQCRERYHTQAELLENAREFRRRRLPVDVMVQDWLYWGKYGWNAMRFDEATYPDPAGMVRDLHAMDMRLMLSVWSKIGRETEVGKQAGGLGYYIPNTDWIDFYNPEAAAFYARNQSRRLGVLGIDAWWQDATEPENDDLVGRDTAAGPGGRTRLTYPLQVSRTVYDEQRRAFPDKRVMILTRSAFPGQQRYAAATWSGDIGNNWETLKRQIPAGLNMAAAGYPYWTVDAGGFFRPGKSQYTDPAYHERFLRWLQYATFLPLQRVHGYQTDTELWRFGDTVERIGRQYLELRYRLMPYIYSMAADCWRTGAPLMRPLVFDFPDDVRALEQGHSYMFGRALHVAPVLAAGVAEWPVYLPPTQGGWHDYWTGERREGGKVHPVPVPIERVPLHVRAGSVVAHGPVTQSTAESIRNRIELHVYAGADGAADIYEDGGLDYRYEKGDYAIAQARWNDAARTLTLHGSGAGTRGAYASTRFHVVVHDGSGRATQPVLMTLDARPVSRRFPAAPPI